MAVTHYTHERWRGMTVYLDGEAVASVRIDGDKWFDDVDWESAATERLTRWCSNNGLDVDEAQAHWEWC